MPDLISFFLNSSPPDFTEPGKRRFECLPVSKQRQLTSAGVKEDTVHDFKSKFLLTELKENNKSNTVAPGVQRAE